MLQFPEPSPSHVWQLLKMVSDNHFAPNGFLDTTTSFSEMESDTIFRSRQTLRRK
jgi:hypothetical protein